MEKKTIRNIFLVVIVVYFLLSNELKGVIPKIFHNLLQVVWFITIIYFFFWLRKNDYFKKKSSLIETANNRAKILKETGVIHGMVNVGYVMGVIAIGVGIYATFLNSPPRYDIFITMTILGLGFMAMFYFLDKQK